MTDKSVRKEYSDNVKKMVGSKKSAEKIAEEIYDVFNN